MMVIEKIEENTIKAGDVVPGSVVLFNNRYWIRGDHHDEYGDPLFINLKDGEIEYPDVLMLCTPIENAKVVL